MFRGGSQKAGFSSARHRTGDAWFGGDFLAVRSTLLDYGSHVPARCSHAAGSAHGCQKSISRQSRAGTAEDENGRAFWRAYSLAS